MTAEQHTPQVAAKPSAAETSNVPMDEHRLTVQACESLRQHEAQLGRLKDDVARYVAWTPDSQMPSGLISELDSLKVKLAQVRATLGRLLESR
jgi:hypothetical protein